MAIVHCGSLIFSEIQAILFDKDGTLADSQQFLKALAERRSHLINAQVPTVQSALLDAFGLRQGQLDPAGLMAVGTRLENEIAAAVCLAQKGHDWIEAKTIAQSVLGEADRSLPRKASLTPPFEGALPLLKSLAALGLKLGILSADSQENVQDFVAYYQLAPYLKLQMGTPNGLSKPDPQLLKMACEALGVSPATTIVVGDSQADMQLAHTGGAIAAVGVTWGGTHPNSLADADIILDRFDEIQAWARL
ncbi:HAD family hydrolase [Phormidesmis priestleyi]